MIIDITAMRGVENLIGEARKNAGLFEALRQTLEERTRHEGLHANVVPYAMRFNLTCFEDVEFPDPQGSHFTSPRLGVRSVLCFTPAASRLLGTLWREGVEMIEPI